MRHYDYDYDYDYDTRNCKGERINSKLYWVEAEL